MAIPLETTVHFVAWCERHVRPMIASLAGQGHIDALEAMKLMQGCDGAVSMAKYVQDNADAIKRAAQR